MGMDGKSAGAGNVLDWETRAESRTSRNLSLCFLCVDFDCRMNRAGEKCVLVESSRVQGMGRAWCTEYYSNGSDLILLLRGDESTW